MRRCGNCTLCCKLVPVKELNKQAGVRCEHQRMSAGCKIYQNRPISCRLWSCRWLTDPINLRRPDFSHYVIDPTPDYVTAIPEGSPKAFDIPVIQVWCDPRHPDAWRDPALLAYIDGCDGYGAIIRYDNAKAKVIFPPSLTGIGWVENDTATSDKPEHTYEEIRGVVHDL